MQKFFLKVRFFCLTFFAFMSVVLMILLFRQKLVSDDAFKMTYPEVVFENKILFDRDLAISSLRDLIVPFLEQDKLLDLDIVALSNEIMVLPWVENVSVIRDFPNVLKIIIKPKEVIAYKANENGYYPIDKNGKVLNMSVEYQNGLLVFGEEAEENLLTLLEYLKNYPNIMKNVVGVQFVNKLRWNLLFFNMDESGILVKLDNDFEEGLSKLAELEFLQGILSKNISEIDLRDLDKILVKQRGNYGI
ncbi:MAG: cell division protein FtsQ/DivIB [Alphaproteobacteria bacterium]|nr:cell division protein FtsQ/DivIB [Alphaproteobacteria bacterium]